MCAIRGERIARRHWMHSECAILPKDPNVDAATGMLVDTIRWSLVYVLLEYLQPGPIVLPPRKLPAPGKDLLYFERRHPILD